MPISEEMFKILGDYSDLNDLHPYGDFLALYSLTIRTSIAESDNIFNDLRKIDDRILTVYVSYILARAGYFALGFVEPTEDDRERDLLTTEFSERDWLELIDYFEHDEEGFRNEWSMEYQNSKNQRIRVFFITFLTSAKDPVTKKYSESIRLAQLMEMPSNNNVDNCVFVIHPRLTRKAKEAFIRTKEGVKNIVGQDIVFSTGQFACRFIADEEKRKLIEANWQNLREKILRDFQKEWPILINSVHEKQLAESREQLRKARLTFELGNDLRGAVLEAGIASEGILKILHSVYGKETGEKMDFNDYLCDVRDTIIEDYGKDIYSDLDFLREWRNKTAHPPMTVPNRTEALKVLTKAELFQDLFLNSIRRHYPRALD